MMAAQPTTILVANEEPPLLRLVARILELEGYRVLTAGDGQQALNQLENQCPDLLMLALGRSVRHPSFPLSCSRLTGRTTSWPKR